MRIKDGERLVAELLKQKGDWGGLLTQRLCGEEDAIYTGAAR